MHIMSDKPQQILMRLASYSANVCPAITDGTQALFAPVTSIIEVGIFSGRLPDIVINRKYGYKERRASPAILV